MTKYWTDPHLRRVFIALSSLALLLLLALRFFVLPHFAPGVTEIQWFTIASQILDALLGTLFSSIVVAGVILWLTLPEQEIKSTALIRAPLINESAPSACANTPYWWYRGHTGAFVRTTVMPALAKAAKKTKTARQVRLILLDPRDTALLEEFIHFRNSVVQPPRKGLTVKAVEKRILASALAGYLWSTSSSLLSAEIILRREFSALRLDLCDQFALITTEDPREPAIRIACESALWRAWKLEFELEARRGEVLRIPNNAIDKIKLEPTEIAAVVGALGINKDFPVEFWYEVIQELKNAENPYGRWLR